MKSPEQSFASQPESKENYIKRLTSKAYSKLKIPVLTLLLSANTLSAVATVDTVSDDKKPKKTTAQKAEIRKKILGTALMIGDVATANASDQTRSTYNKAKQGAIAAEGVITTIENNKK